MKRNIFFSGLGDKFALVTLALTGVLFTSCEKEDFDATFDANPARATINVNVIEFPSGTAVSNVAISADKGEVSGTVVTLKGGADGSIPAQDVKIDAAAPDGYEPIQSVTIHVNALRAGGEAAYNATLVAVKTATPEEPDQVVINAEFTPGETLIEYPLNYKPTHNHAGQNWVENASDYNLALDVKYKRYNEQTAASNVSGVDVSNFIEGLKYNKTADVTCKITIPAWSLYRIWTETYRATTVYTFKYKESEEILGMITVNAKYGTAMQYEVMDNPNQHGHGHGASENAGGGIGLSD